MAGKYRVIVSEEAKTMLLDHMRFLSNVSIPASRKFLLAFKEAKAQLSAFPLSGPFDENPVLPAKTYRKCLFYGRYLFYTRSETTPFILMRLSIAARK